MMDLETVGCFSILPHMLIGSKLCTAASKGAVANSQRHINSQGLWDIPIGLFFPVAALLDGTTSHAILVRPKMAASVFPVLLGTFILDCMTGSLEVPDGSTWESWEGCQKRRAPTVTLGTSVMTVILVAPP